MKKTWEDIQHVTGTVDKCGTWRRKQISLDISIAVADIEGIQNFIIFNDINHLWYFHFEKNGLS